MLLAAFLVAHIQAAVPQHPQAAFQPPCPKPAALHGIIETKVLHRHTKTEQHIITNGAMELLFELAAEQRLRSEGRGFGGCFPCGWALRL